MTAILQFSESRFISILGFNGAVVCSASGCDGAARRLQAICYWAALQKARPHGFIAAYRNPLLGWRSWCSESLDATMICQVVVNTLSNRNVCRVVDISFDGPFIENSHIAPRFLNIFTLE